MKKSQLYGVKCVKTFTCITLSVLLLSLSKIASASYVITTDGFIDTSANLRWLNPSLITSESVYRSYVSNGWRVARTELTTLYTGGFVPYNDGLVNAFLSISNSLTLSSTFCYSNYSVNFVDCSFGWAENDRDNGVEYDMKGIVLESESGETDIDILRITQPNIIIYLNNGTVGAYPLYYDWGQGTNYETFMVKAAAAVVPIPASVWLFGSGLLGLVGMTRRKKA